ncbi:hypothetical protein HanPI659440_Chr10g0372951 [Helianthus annuus]|nr:hypothetical protein HanPI659440_Chr10g0372951 [Helianthus annuus]
MEGIFVNSFYNRYSQISKTRLKTHRPFPIVQKPTAQGRETTYRTLESKNGKDLVGADQDDDGGFEVTVRVCKREEHRLPDLGFLEGLVFWQGFHQLRRRSATHGRRK